MGSRALSGDARHRSRPCARPRLKRGCGAPDSRWAFCRGGGRDCHPFAGSRRRSDSRPRRPVAARGLVRGRAHHGGRYPPVDGHAGDDRVVGGHGQGPHQDHRASQGGRPRDTALESYVTYYRERAGQAIELWTLVVQVLQQFLDLDHDFQAWRRRTRHGPGGGPAVGPGESGREAEGDVRARQTVTSSAVQLIVAAERVAKHALPWILRRSRAENAQTLAVGRGPAFALRGVGVRTPAVPRQRSRPGRHWTG
jgi:hypothetical protein